MQSRVGLVAPWRWLQQGVALLRAHPRPLLGGAAMLVAVALLPSVLVAVAAPLLPPAGAQALGAIASLLLYPPAVGGYLRVIHARQAGQDLPAAAMFATFADGPASRRLVIGNLVMVSGFMLAIALLAFGLGGESLLGYFQQLSVLKPGVTPPALPAGALPFALVLLLLGVYMLAAQGLAFAELALGTRPPLPAIGAALGTSARHYGVWLLFFVPAMFLAFLVFMLVALAAVLLAAMLAVASAALGKLVVALCTVALMVSLYALLFAFFYFAWRELSGAPAPPPQPPPHRIAA
jgi:hypothetical protein